MLMILSHLRQLKIRINRFEIYNINNIYEKVLKIVKILNKIILLLMSILRVMFFTYRIKYRALKFQFGKQNTINLLVYVTKE